MLLRNGVLATTLLFLSSCAWNYAVPITDANRNESGIRYYGTKPLLVVSSSETKVIFVPNYSKEYAFKFGAFLAKNDITLDVSDAQTLAQINAKPDGTGPISDFFDFASEAVKQGSGGLLGTLMSANNTGNLQIFDIIYNDDSSIKELRPLLSEDTTFLDMPLSTGSSSVPKPGQAPNPNEKKSSNTAPNVQPSQ